MINQDSRYAHAPLALVNRPDGTQVRFVVPPILPHPDDLTTAQMHRVTDSDRPDVLAAQAYGQATAWTLLADANSQTHPDQLTQTPGTVVKIPRPEGMG